MSTECEKIVSSEVEVRRRVLKKQETLAEIDPELALRTSEKVIPHYDAVFNDKMKAIGCTATEDSILAELRSRI